MAKSQSKPAIELAAMMQQSRLARIIELLWQHRNFIIEVDKVQITFDCAGSNVEPTIKLRPSSSK